MHRPIRPQDLTLLIGIPLDQGAFFRALESGSDFLSANHLGDTGAWARYAPTAKAVDEILNVCSKMGARVVRDATFEDYHADAVKYLVLGLLAHIRYERITISDVVDPPAFCRRIRTGQEIELDLLRRAAPGADSVESIVDAANFIFEAVLADFDGKRAQTIGMEIFGDEALAQVRLDRARLEELCGPETLRPARAIHFTDGGRTTREFWSALPEGQERLLDLSNCRSIVTGTAVRRNRPEIQSLIGRRDVDPIIAAELWKLRLGLIERAAKKGKPITYQEADEQVTRALRGK